MKFKMSSHKRLIILLLLQTMFFIQCTNAETKHVNENEPVKNTKPGTNGNAKPVSKTKSITKMQKFTDGDFKQIKFGFNIGYLGSLQSQPQLYAKPLSQIKSDGITDVRAYEPFNKEASKNPSLIATEVKVAVDQGFNMLLCFSDYPFVDGQQNDMSGDSHADMMKYTNRYPPADMDKYGTILNGVLSDLQNNNLMQNLSFEIGNEPTAKKYFWGTGADFSKIAHFTKNILLKYNRPVYCCGFNTEYVADNSSADYNYINLLNDNDFFKKVDLSFHFYPNQKYEFGNITLPRAQNSIITEFNLFSYQKQENQSRIDYTNSPAFGKWFSELLEYTYTNNLQEVYLFNLVDDPNKQGALGFFNSDGSPKPSYQYFIKLYDVVKNGYKVQANNNVVKIIGRTQTIVYSKNGNSFFGRGFGNNADQKINLNNNNWKIVNN